MILTLFVLILLCNYFCTRCMLFNKMWILQIASQRSKLFQKLGCHKKKLIWWELRLNALLIWICWKFRMMISTQKNQWILTITRNLNLASTNLSRLLKLGDYQIPNKYSKKVRLSIHPVTFYFLRGILSNFILDSSLQSALPVFCLCDADDGERTSTLGIERGKNRELTHYKITVAGPITSSHPSIQFDNLKSEMAFMTGAAEVGRISSLIAKCIAINNNFCTVYNTGFRRLRGVSWNQSKCRHRPERSVR